MAVPDDDFLYNRLQEDRKRHTEEAKKDYSDKSKTQLLAVVDKKLHTTFIGALAQFEKEFGFLWGQKGREITEDEKEILELLESRGYTQEYFEDIWLDARDRVLENGNNQLKALKKEIKNYTVSWNRVRQDLVVRYNQNTNDQ